ncbi:P-loop NTPase fold protein [Thalassoglobus sp. JC818]|uniref:P-loop NTPase fold protein n=1 Tax=Thalassoglobus sp. JC818 TaxID=3232136 RepID=UPI00345B459E
MNSLEDFPTGNELLFLFSACVLMASVLFKLFSPRLSHLKYFWTHPPTWSAWLVGGVLVCGFDLCVGLSNNTYSASCLEWLFYGGGSILTVALVRLLSSVGDYVTETAESVLPISGGLDAVDWSKLEPWLQSDAPAAQDFLGNYSVSQRLSGLLADGIRSIGIVAPFGAGKSSVVNWIEKQLNQDSGEYLISKHSCWGFETSRASIHSLLADAIGKVEERVDTFEVSSLPESYRQTFSAGGEWLDNVSSILFGQRNPIDQFRQLSALLGDINVRLVFVVEDLDRNNSQSFDIQDVLAFLQQLKDFPNLSFILTGGLNSTARIDFAKLCDHIEYLRTISIQQAGDLVSALRQRCFDQEAISHICLADPSSHSWQTKQWLHLPFDRGIHPLESIARLLNTPRALRHALSLTYRGWQNLYGEINFDHLLAVNVLRYVAPEAFSFVLRHWHRFHEKPPEYVIESDRMDRIQTSLCQEWSEVCSVVDWDVEAARALIDLILPSAQLWLEGTDSSSLDRLQGVQDERYWNRALTENVSPDDVRDQTVLRDIKQWFDNPIGEAALAVGISTDPAYSTVWEYLAHEWFYNQRDEILLLSSQVLAQIQQRDGCEASNESQGFMPVERFASRNVELVKANAKWLEGQISEAATSSLELVNSLWYYWGAGVNGILRPEDRDRVRRHINLTLQQQLVTPEAFAQIVNPSSRYTIYHLVFDPGGHTPVHAGTALWKWIGPVLMEGVRCGQVAAAIGVCGLILKRDGSSLGVRSTADMERLREFFGDDAVELVNGIENLVPEIDENNRAFVKEIVHSARSSLGTEI